MNQVLTRKRLQLIFVSVLLHKIARNAFYYTFSKWLAVEYHFNVQQTACFTLCIVAGSVFGSVCMPLVMKTIEMNVYMIAFMSCCMAICAMIPEPICAAFGIRLPVWSVCVVVFFYFCGCQVWYNHILEIMINVTPTPKLLPAVNTILKLVGCFGNIIGTIGSTVWYSWGGHVGICVVCAVANLVIGCIVLILWRAHSKQKSKKMIAKSRKKVSKRGKNGNILQGDHPHEQNKNNKVDLAGIDENIVVGD